MSFLQYKDTIEENDLVMLHVNFQSTLPVKVTGTVLSKKGVEIEHVVQTKYGGLKVADLVGKKFGTKVELTRGYAYALHPTPELWTKALPHRTQILYGTDISLILLELELRPGSVCVESGTGSGSLSHSLIRTIAPSGHLHTFDFHQQRVEKAKEEFQEHGLEEFVTCSHRDVCAEGFGLTDTADAVFLDLPHPWKVVPYAKTALKVSGGRLCSFSPCIEQVQRTCEALKEHGFTEIATRECLLREFQVRRISLPLFDPKREWVAGGGGDPPQEDVEEELEEEEGERTNGHQQQQSKKRPHEDSQRTEQRQPQQETKFITGLPLTSMPGHTGYLTFATLPATL